MYILDLVEFQSFHGVMGIKMQSLSWNKKIFFMQI